MIILAFRKKVGVRAHICILGFIFFACCICIVPAGVGSNPFSMLLFDVMGLQFHKNFSFGIPSQLRYGW